VILKRPDAVPNGRPAGRGKSNPTPTPTERRALEAAAAALDLAEELAAMLLKGPGLLRRVDLEAARDGFRLTRELVKERLARVRRSGKARRRA